MTTPRADCLLTFTPRERGLYRLAGPAMEPLPQACRPVGLVVGESNPYGGTTCPLFPWPEGSAGHRLWRYSGVPLRDWLVSAARRNLVDQGLGWERWDRRAARRGMIEALELAGRLGVGRVLLLGRKVAEAVDSELLVWDDVALPQIGAVVASAPHPSGRNRSLNTPDAQARMREVALWVAGGPVPRWFRTRSSPRHLMIVPQIPDDRLDAGPEDRRTRS